MEWLVSRVPNEEISETFALVISDSDFIREREVMCLIMRFFAHCDRSLQPMVM